MITNIYGALCINDFDNDNTIKRMLSYCSVQKYYIIGHTISGAYFESAVYAANDKRLINDIEVFKGMIDYFGGGTVQVINKITGDIIYTSYI